MSKTVLITGSSRGIGRAIAEELANDGYEVVVHCRSRVEDANEVIASITDKGGTARLLQFDVSDRDACREALEQDIETHGVYYGVVCNAGITRDQPFPGLEGDDWDQVISTNLDSFYNVLHPLIMPMVRARCPGRVVTLSSVSGLMGNRGQVNYSAAKGGIIAATKALAIEMAKRNITVNCVVPGIIDTEMVSNADLPPGIIKEIVPMQRLGEPEEVAGLVQFLMSDRASYITRQVICVNGGMC